MTDPGPSAHSPAVPPRPGPAAIVAIGRDGSIGRRGALPWQAPEDMAHFRAVTMGHHVILGSSTWDSIGRPLPGRHLVVVSRRALDLPDGVVLASSPEAGLALALETDESPIIAGGTSIYAALLPETRRIHLTEVAVEVPDADAWFPPFEESDWNEVAAWSGDDERLTFRVLDRR